MMIRMTTFMSRAFGWLLLVHDDTDSVHTTHAQLMVDNEEKERERQGIVHELRICIIGLR